jgi:putative pre-16S rRNA nuclease
MSEFRKGCLLGLDVGDVRIGVAISRSGVIAEPLVTIERIGRRQTLNAIEELVKTNSVDQCVVGLPSLESGVEGEQVEKTRAFIRSLSRRIPQLKIEFYDERYTSSRARDIAGDRVQGADNKGLIDRIAAAVILQDYLDYQENTTEEKK